MVCHEAPYQHCEGQDVSNSSHHVHASHDCLLPPQGAECAGVLSSLVHQKLSTVSFRTVWSGGWCILFIQCTHQRQDVLGSPPSVRNFRHQGRPHRRHAPQNDLRLGLAQSDVIGFVDEHAHEENHGAFRHTLDVGCQSEAREGRRRDHEAPAESEKHKGGAENIEGMRRGFLRGLGWWKPSFDTFDAVICSGCSRSIG